MTKKIHFRSADRKKIHGLMTSKSLFCTKKWRRVYLVKTNTVSPKGSPPGCFLAMAPSLLPGQQTSVPGFKRLLPPMMGNLAMFKSTFFKVPRQNNALVSCDGQI